MLDLSSLLQSEPSTNGEPIFIDLSVHVLDCAIAGRLEHIDGALADAADKEQPLPLSERLGTPRRLADPTEPQLLHGDLRRRLDPIGCLGPTEPWNPSELARIGFDELLRRAEAQLVERVGQDLVDPLNRRKRDDGLFLDLLELRLTDDVELPARKLRGKTYVLSSTTDGQGELVVGDDELHRPVGFIDDHTADFCRCDRAANEPRRITIPWHDIDLLAAKLLHDGLNARSLHADASANRIDIEVPRGNSNFRSRAGLTCRADDANDPLVDLGNLLLETLDEETNIGPRKDDQGTTGFTVDILDVRHNPIAWTIGLTGDLLASREDCLGPTQVDDDIVAPLVTPNDTGDQLTLAIFVLVIDVLALSISDTLDDDLFGRLRRDAAEATAIGLELEQVAVFFVLLLGLVGVLFAVEDLESEFFTQIR